MASPSKTDDNFAQHDYPSRERERPLSPTEARQASYGRPVLIVLLAGLLLAMVVWIPAEWWGNSIAPEQPANQPPATTAPSPAEQTPGAQPQSQP